MTPRTYAILLVGLLLLACQAQAPPAQPLEPENPVVLPEEPAPPEAPVTDEPAEMEEVDNALDDVFGPIDESQVVTIDDISCDAEARELQFRFRNIAEKTWQLNQELPFPAPADMGSVRITLNSYEVNSKKEVLAQGEVMFGPNHPFSENCGGVEELAPGESVECTVSPVPLKSSTGFGYGANELRINGVGASGIVRFTCG